MNLKRIFYIITMTVVFFAEASFSQQNNIALLNSEGRSFNFIVIGDRTGAGPDTWKILRKSISEINKINPDFVIFIGDLIDGYDLKNVSVNIQWDKFDKVSSSLKVPYFYVVGNHDIYNQHSMAVWKKRIGKTYFSFKYKDAGFIIISTEESGNWRQGGLGRAEVEFIKNAVISFSQEKHIFLLMHRPMWLSPGPLKNEWKEIRRFLGTKKFTVIAGHLHALSETEDSQGNRYIIVGPTGAKMRFPRNPALALFQHYTLFSVKNSSLGVAFIEPGRVYSESIAKSAYKRYKATMFMYAK